jgi:hypothetical protein
MADVSVVEPHHPKAARRQQRAEVLIPAQHLRAQAHDQEQRRGVRLADLLVGELDAVGGSEALFAETRHPERS